MRRNFMENNYLINKEWLSTEKGGAIELENEMILSVAYLIHDI